VALLLTTGRRKLPVILALNQCDRLLPAHVQENTTAYAALAPEARSMLVSATRGDNLEELVGLIVEALPPSPQLFPEDQVTDQQVRFMAGELVREQVLLNLRDEVPHAVAVLIDRFEERDGGITYISAVIFVERETQKRIVLGKDGQMIKRIGQAARLEIEALLETRVYLDLWVKVRPKWRTDPEELRRLGYRMPRKKGKKGGG
jgi:GTP-binding protein Era